MLLSGSAIYIGKSQFEGHKVTIGGETLSLKEAVRIKDRDDLLLEVVRNGKGNEEGRITRFFMNQHNREVDGVIVMKRDC